MNPEFLFCWAFMDLSACGASSFHYHQLRIAGLLRLFLIDEYPLVHQVNRLHRLKLSFEHGAGATATEPDPKNDLTHDGITFATSELAPSRLLASATRSQSSLDEWLKTGVLRVSGRVLTVHEFVQEMAYLEGLTHAGQPKTAAEQDLVTIRKNAFRRVDNMSEPHLDLLKQIGAVTHTGLRPLFNAAKVSREREGWHYPTFDYG
jgi:hypothetical protein